MSLLETRTISLRIKQVQLQNDIVEILRSATHFKNMMIILLKRVYQADERLYSLLLNPDVVRAILYDRSGGKKAVLVKECKSFLSSMTKQDQDFYEQIRGLAQQFDAKHIARVNILNHMKLRHRSVKRMPVHLKTLGYIKHVAGISSRKDSFEFVQDTHDRLYQPVV